MKGFFCRCTARTNEEYRKIVKLRMKLMIGMAVIGILTAALGFSGEFYWHASISDKMLGFYSGFGTSLFAAGIILYIKNRLLLKNDEKLKASRLSNTDERIREISNKAFRTATYIMLVVLYGVMLIGGLFYPILIEFLAIIICSFVVTYFIAYKHYNAKM